MSIKFEISGSQITGDRDYQEDSFLITHLGSSSKGSTGSLVVVADGMGGHTAGNIASNMAVQAFNQYVTSHYSNDNPATILRESVYQANQAIANAINETEGLRGMGCTLVGVLLEKNQLYWVSVGDSHLYLIRESVLEKKNEDHSYGGYLENMKAQGHQIETEASYSKNMLMSALTGIEITAVDCPTSPLELQHGDRILLCSDGMDTLTNQHLLELSWGSNTAQAYQDTLLKRIEQQDMPRQDNTTAIVVDVADSRKAALSVNRKQVTRQKIADAETLELQIDPKATGKRAKSSGSRSKWGIRMLLSTLLIGLVGGGYWFYASGRLDVANRFSADPKIEPAAPKQATLTNKTHPVDKAQEKKLESPVNKSTNRPINKPEKKTALQSPPKLKSFQDRMKNGGSAPKMVFLPGSTYKMGSPPSSLKFEERPQHKVKIKPFAVSKYEISFSEYEQFARATRRQMPRLTSSRRTPIRSVTWNDATRYAKWLSKQTGKRYQLPSEAQWEYAASTRATTPYWWGNERGTGRAHCLDCSAALYPRLPVTVGSFTPNSFGLHDTAGNVWEWTQDCYHSNYEGAPTDGSVWQGGDCTLRMVRGGSFRTPSKSLRTTNREKLDPTQVYDDVGFRIVRLR